MRLALLFALVGCGRIDFDLRGDGALADGVPDAWPYACLPNTALPAQLTVSGVTFRYTSATNMSTPVSNVRVTATKDLGGPTIGQVTSDGVGAYTMSIDTSAGPPGDVTLTYSAVGNFTSNLFLSQPLDRDVIGTRVPAWVPGDGPIWNTAQMDSVYAAASPQITRVATRGTLNVAVHDCAERGIAGVTVTIDPPPETTNYQAADGTLVQSGQTIAPFTHAIAFNALPGPTRISATGAGRNFPDVTVNVIEGSTNTLAIIRAAE